MRDIYYGGGKLVMARAFMSGDSSMKYQVAFNNGTAAVLDKSDFESTYRKLSESEIELIATLNQIGTLFYNNKNR